MSFRCTSTSPVLFYLCIFILRFDLAEDVSSTNVIKSSVQRGMLAQLQEQFPNITHCLNEIIPDKKGGLKVSKCQEHVEIVSSQDGEPLFFRHRDGPFFPVLKLVHKYPYILPVMKVDKGAIKFVISGANIMCPGLTSKGGKMTKVPANSVVAITAEGKEHALGVGLTKLSSEDIIKINKDVGIENIHYLNDGLWKTKVIR